MKKNPFYPFATLLTIFLILASACSLPGLPSAVEPVTPPAEPPSAKTVPNLTPAESPAQQPTATPQFPFET